MATHSEISAPALHPVELDPDRYARRKAEGEYRLNVFLNPPLRLVGFSLVVLAVWLHDRYVLPVHDARAWFPTVALVLGTYPLWSWAVLYAGYRRWPRLAFAFLYLDILMMMLAIWATGAERSLLFFLPLFRVIDQVHTSLRRALYFGHVAIGTYLLLILWVARFEGHAVSWPAEVVKMALLYGSMLYTAITARGAEQARQRTASVIAMLRGAMADMEAKSKELESSQLQLRRAIHQNELILQSAGEGIVGVDVDGRITMVNSRAAHTIGFDAQEMIGRTGHQLAVHARPDGRICDGIGCPLEQALASGREEHGENAGFFRADGTQVPVEYTSAPMFEDGRLAGAVFSFRDISERQRLAREIEAARDAAERASSAKSQFLANMSHELRTPLNAIIGYSDMLQEEAADGGHEEIVPDLRKINTAGKHLLAMLTDVLDIAKIEAGRMQLAVETVDVPTLVTEIEHTVAPLCHEKANRFVATPAAGVTVETDAAKLRRILLNLLSNANKFTEAGEIRLGVSADDGAVHFSVRDTGIGITKEQREQIFGAFTQGDGTSTRRHGGTGLGLAISQRLAEMLGATILVDSTPGEGSTFTLRVPRESVATRETAAS
jgi:PAS domain S-box-containing protein